MFNKISNLVYGDDLRKSQVQAIEFLERNIDKQDDLIMQLPTGVGKSLIAYAFSHSKKLAKYRDDMYAPGSYILSTTKQLSDQYINDFGKLFTDGLGTMFTCKAAQNYVCNCNQHSNCLQVRTLRRLLKHAAPKFLTLCKDSCCYDMAKKLLFGQYDHKQGCFVQKPQLIGVTNYKYILNMFKYTKEVHPKSLLVMDQAHNVQLELMSFIELDFSKRFIVQRLGFDSMVLDYHKDDFLSFIKNEYMEKLTKLVSNLKTRINQKGHSDLQAVKDYQKYDRHVCKVNRFLEQHQKDGQNWIYQKEQNTSYFRPIYVHDYAKECLFNVGKKRIYMSATIGNPQIFRKSLGIKDYGFLTMDSPFPRQNRKIYYVPCGKMSRDAIQTSLPNVAKAVDQIMTEFPNEKGIVHTNSYKIANRIKKGCKNPKNRNRFVDHQDSSGRLVALLQHQQSDEPTVLLSPSMSEGIDLKDDLSRFQILTKIPYPNLGDERIKIRCKRDYTWYVNEAVKGIVQSYGRSIRTQKDHADTFILDGCFEDLLHKNGKLFPKWFIDALR